MTNLVRGALLACVLLPSLGCVAVIPYDPDATQVDKLGKDGAAARLREVLNRAVAPRVTAVDVSDDFLRMQWVETVPGPWYVPQPISHDIQIYYANIARTELYENHNVFVWAPQDSRVDKVMFSNQEDAKAFLDLLMSFRASRLGR